MNTHRLSALGLAAFLAAGAAASAQDIKFSVPGDKAPAGPTTAAPAAAFTNLQIAEEAGWVMAKQTGVADLGFNQAETDAFIKGFSGAIQGGKPPYDFKTMVPQLDAFMQHKQAAFLQQVRQQNIAASNAMFAKVRQDKDVITLPSGLSYKIIATGYGEYPKPNDVVRVNYTGVFTDGTVFDTSVKQGHPVDMALDRMIPGWIEGMQKINKGGRIRLFIPSSLAYGDNGFRGIPPAAALIFDIELVDIKPPGSPTSAPEGAGSN